LTFSDKVFGELRIVLTFAARKRGRGKGIREAEKRRTKNKKNKVCKREKGSYLCSPKRKGQKNKESRERLPVSENEKLKVVKGLK
jgi:stringent starvation protein B